MHFDFKITVASPKTYNDYTIEDVIIRLASNYYLYAKVIRDQ